MKKHDLNGMVAANCGELRRVGKEYAKTKGTCYSTLLDKNLITNSTLANAMNRYCLMVIKDNKYKVMDTDIEQEDIGIIHKDTLTKICQIFEVTPNDFIIGAKKKPEVVVETNQSNECELLKEEIKVLNNLLQVQINHSQIMTECFMNLMGDVKDMRNEICKRQDSKDTSLTYAGKKVGRSHPDYDKMGGSK